jgi:hypothetical protein
MFDTSKDILNIVLSVSVACVAFFLSLGLFYLAMMLRKAYMMLKEAGEIVNNVKDTTRIFKEKVESSASYFVLMAEGMKKIIALVKEKSSSKRAKKSQNDKIRTENNEDL